MGFFKSKEEKQQIKERKEQERISKKQASCKCKREWWVEDSGRRVAHRIQWVCSKCGQRTDFERI